MTNALYDLVVLNSLRAVHAKQVNIKMHRDLKHSVVEDAIKLLEIEKQIRRYERDWVHKYYTEAVPMSISVKQYAELMGVSTSTVYRHIKSNDILATKIKNRWQIHTNIQIINEVA